MVVYRAYKPSGKSMRKVIGLVLGMSLISAGVAFAATIPVAPTCTASVNVVLVGANVAYVQTVTWSTKNAQQVTLDGVSVASSGSKNFNEVGPVDFTIVASSNHGVATCPTGAHLIYHVRS